MTTADLVNRIIEKLGGNRVEFLGIPGDGCVFFRHAGNKYRVAHRSIGVICSRYCDIADDYLADTYSQWIEGVLNGKTRDEAGVLS